MKLLIRSDRGATLVENRFIDEYMPTANGEYVKVYLYLLRCASSGRDLSVSSIADVFDHTESDICRALRYWEKKGLLHMETDAAQLPLSLTFLSPEESRPSGAALPASGRAEKVLSHPVIAAETSDSSGSADEAYTSSGRSAAGLQSTSVPAGEHTAAQPELPHRLQPAAARKKALTEDTEFSQLIYVFQVYVGRPLTSQEINNLIYFYDDLHFSADLIEYLLEYCADKGNPGPKYMEKVAQEWYKAGFTTPSQAKKDVQSHRKEFYTIFKYLGITGRSPGEAEIAFMKKWLNQYELPMEVIKEGCERTLLNAGKPDLRYLDRILSSWHEANVRSTADIAAADEKRTPAGGKSSGRENKPVRSPRSSPKSGDSANKFNSFEQRGYDWEDLTAKLTHS